MAHSRALIVLPVPRSLDLIPLLTQELVNPTRYVDTIPVTQTLSFTRLNVPVFSSSHKSTIRCGKTWFPLPDHFLKNRHSVAQLTFQVVEQVDRPRRGGPGYYRDIPSLFLSFAPILHPGSGETVTDAPHALRSQECTAVLRDDDVAVSQDRYVISRDRNAWSGHRSIARSGKGLFWIRGADGRDL
ncbi:unnamed protein product [Ranitomeya imitator]|uniref:Uncharacterized protein n=1 Tax=Ranitomeya imitator TaxID=111125 RepID=A0ABN9LU47_9NEOB|nr:unnamed protein product [Ranitomeya imitator]